MVALKVFENALDPVGRCLQEKVHKFSFSHFASLFSVIKFKKIFNSRVIWVHVFVCATFNEANCTGSCKVISTFFLIYVPPLLKNSLSGRCELAGMINKLADRNIFFYIYFASSDDIALLEIKLAKNHSMHRFINYLVVW